VSPLSEQDQAWRRDTAFQNRCRDIRIELAAFLNEPNSKLWPKTHQEIQKVMGLLVEQEQSVVQTWN
jgi:hypothetical protein